MVQSLKEGRDHPDRIEGIRRAKTGQARPDLRGENNPNWKGGTYGTERHTEMGRVEYKTWRLSVLKRDDFACVLCGQAGRLEAHHIRPWRTDRASWYDPDNGVALCVACHRTLRGRETEFVGRFDDHVASARPVPLTLKEQEQFLPFVTACHLCGATITRPRWHRSKKLHFCNNEHRREFERSIGGNWRGYLNNTLDICVNGHLRSEHTGWRTKGSHAGKPYCKACARERAARRRKAKRASNF